ncbi:MAG: LLM class flavin-dependent oxidoreductase [Candidatus Odinarchaeia archaeon]
MRTSIPDFSLGLTTGFQLKTAINFTKIAEKNQYKIVWIGDDILKNEIFTYLAILANNIKKIKIGTGIVSPYVYPIHQIASEAATINEIVNGNLILGIGVGGEVEVTKITGHKPKNVLQRMRNTTLIFKKIISGKKVSFKDEFEELNGFKLSFKVDNKIPIFFGVRGPKLLSLAGEISDGVIFSAPLAILKKSINIVEKSAVKNNRNPNNIRKILWNALILLDGYKTLELAKDVVMIIISSLSKENIINSKISLELANSIREEYARGRLEEAKQLIDEELIGKLTIFGDIEELKNQFSRIYKLGIDEIVIGPPFGSKPKKVLEKLNPTKFWRK